MDADTYITAGEIADYVECKRKWWKKRSASAHQKVSTTSEQYKNSSNSAVNTSMNSHIIFRLFLIFGIICIIILIGLTVFRIL